MSGQEGIGHGEFRHHFMMAQGSNQSGESLACFRFIESGGMIHSGFGNTSGPPFPIQANRQIRMIRIEIHHQFNCCFRQKGMGNVRGMASAGNPDGARSSGLDCLTGCHAISSSLSEFRTQQPGKDLGGNQSMNASGKNTA